MWSASQTCAFIIAVIVYIWLMVLAYFANKLFAENSTEKKFAFATYFVGTAAGIALLFTIAYA
jgi:hypothetical protein